MKIGPADPEILWLRANKSDTKQNWLPWQRPLRNRKKWTGSRKLTQITSIWYKELALDIGWTFGDEMSRLGLEVVEGDGADNWWVVGQASGYYSNRMGREKF